MVYNRNWTRLTGDIRTRPEDDSLIILVNLEADRHHETKFSDEETSKQNEVWTSHHGWVERGKDPHGSSKPSMSSRL